MKINIKVSDGPAIAIYLFVYISLLLILSLGLSSCSSECETENTYTYFEPVYTSMEDIRSSIGNDTPQEIQQMGKLYFKDNHLFINEPNEGVHVIDNRDPSNPLNVAFITIPGAFDLSIQGNILFSDSYMDLVAVDISDYNQVKEVGRIEDLFSGYNSYGFYADPQLGVVTDWVESNEVNVTESSCEGRFQDWGIYYNEGIALADASAFSRTSAAAPTNPGIGGSMARFTIANRHLFALDGSEVIPVDIGSASAMGQGTRLNLDWGIETIFPRDLNLFIGANDGMYILDIESPLDPRLISKYEHVRSCDPVVVDGDLAFVTLRSGTQCQGFTNQLEVLDITDLSDPQLLYTYEMTNPHGLGKDGDALFVCDGGDGLKAFDASDISKIGNRMTAHYADIFAYDIIPFNNIAMMIGKDGLYQYDYNDINNIQFLSKIELNNED